jgi:hypothetical protein
MAGVIPLAIRTWTNLAYAPHETSPTRLKLAGTILAGWWLAGEQPSRSPRWNLNQICI